MSSKPIRVGIAGENDLDPLDIYYTHSKIRPFFSGWWAPFLRFIQIHNHMHSVNSISWLSMFFVNNIDRELIYEQ